MKSLKHCVELDSTIKIYVPSTTNVDQCADTSEWIDKTLSLLSASFGGATCTQALGCWISNQGNLVKEDVHLCYAFFREADLKKHFDAIYDFILEMKRELSQECIAMELHGKLYLI